jgi:hypothetical protein
MAAPSIKVQHVKVINGIEQRRVMVMAPSGKTRFEWEAKGR